MEANMLVADAVTIRNLRRGRVRRAKRWQRKEQASPPYLDGQLLAHVVEVKPPIEGGLPAFTVVPVIVEVDWSMRTVCLLFLLLWGAPKAVECALPRLSSSSEVALGLPASLASPPWEKNWRISSPVLSLAAATKNPAPALRDEEEGARNLKSGPIARMSNARRRGK